MVEPSSVPIRFEQWEILLKPISEAAPTGQYLQYEKIYDQIKEARREDDPNLPRNEWEKTDLKKADWSQVQELCLEALSNQTKDLQIVVWLTEALLHLYGYNGLKTGLQLLIQLCEKYWAFLFPPIEEGDMEYRIAPLSWLNHDNFIRQLGIVPITAPNGPDTMPYTFIHWQGVQSLEKKQALQKETTVTEGKPTHSQFLTSATLTPHSFYTNLIGDLQESIDSLDLFNQMLNDLCGPLAPSLGKFRQILIDIQHVVNVILVDRPQTSVQALEKTEADLDLPSEAETLEKPEGLKLMSPIRSRREAYQHLAEAADYLERTEPHSPAPYLVKRAISWGNMPLNQLLAEIVNDDKDLKAIYTLLGIQDQSEGKK